MRTFNSLLLAVSLALSVAAQQGPWQQCGGSGWTGATNCVSGYTCTKVNDWYSQCIPGGATTQPPVVTTTAQPPPVTTTTQAPPVTTQPPTGGTCTPLPANINLVANSKLNDPFTFVDGRKVTTKADWECRQKEILELFQRYESGVLPPKPESVTGSLSGNTLTVNVSNAGKSISFTCSITFPSGASGAVPAIINYSTFSSLPSQSGVAVIGFNNNDLAAQDNTGSRGQGKFYTLYGSSHSASAMTAWAWGVSRIMDVLESIGQTRIDTKRVGVTGCSRNGKGAIMAGALEPRIALTIPQESGAGGAACWRISDSLSGAQTARQIITENVWFSTLFNPYVTRVNDLPFDHHLLAGLIAPRGLYIIEHSSIAWLGPRSAYGCMIAGRKIYQALGVPNNMGVSSVAGHEHCQFPSTQSSELAAFVNKFLKGDSNANTNVQRTDQANNLGFVEADWINWSVPTLS